MEQVDDPFCFGGKIGKAGNKASFIRAAAAKQVGHQQRAQGHASQPQAQPGQKAAPV